MTGWTEKNPAYQLSDVVFQTPMPREVTGFGNKSMSMHPREIQDPLDPVIPDKKKDRNGKKENEEGDIPNDRRSSPQVQIEHKVKATDHQGSRIFRIS
jgi:hypothetical protein